MAKFGEMLLSAKLITQKQLDDALAIQQKKRDFLGTIMVANGMVKEDEMLQVLSEQTKYPIAEIKPEELTPDLGKIIPWRIARMSRCVAFKIEDETVHVGFLDTSGSLQVDSLLKKVNRTLKVYLTGPNAITQAWDVVYGDEKTRDANLLHSSMDRLKNNVEKDAKESMSLLKKDYSSGDDEKQEEEKGTLEIKDFDEIVTGVLGEVEIMDTGSKDKNMDYSVSIQAEAPPIIKMVNGILIKSVEMGASDIHIEPFEKMFRVRFRIDGTLHEVMSLPPSVKNSVTSRIKIMAKMDIAERRVPQDGRIKIKLGAKGALDLRVNTLPTVFGEKTVIRLLGQSNLGSGVDKIGFEPTQLEWIKRAMSGTFGMILVTGPTGSGKSTTLYTMLSEMNSPDTNITTAEDPVEYNVTGITQVNVQQSIGFTFDVALRAFLRQDPDIILVGEIRDKETVGIAIKAALTGHLVLSTLHTNDAASTITRLFDMGVDSFMVSAAVKVIIAQRLIRRLCDDCKEQRPLNDDEMHNMKLLGIEDQIDDIKPYSPKGCDKCHDIGYRGRAPVLEVMSLHSKALREAITAGKNNIEIGRIAKEEGMLTIKDFAINLVKRGVTSLEEAFKVGISE
jgi:type IV pilus assembly protein PilB